jgi:transcriptional regulator with XRE-family HTH domain
MIMSSFANRFARLMHEHGWTQLEAAEKLGISQALISRYLSGKRVPLRRTMSHIAMGFGVSVAELTGEKDLGQPRKHRRSRVPTSHASQADQFFLAALANLKTRWRRKPNERDTIRHLIGLLFPREANKILTWLDGA